MATRKPRHVIAAYSTATASEPDEAQLLADRGQREVGVAGRQIARLAQAESGAEDAAGGERPHRLRHLIAAADGVVPRRLPHRHAGGQRFGDVQPVADVEAGDQQRAAGRRRADAAARHRVERQEDARQHQRRPEILLQEEEEQRQPHAADDRHAGSRARGMRSQDGARAGSSAFSFTCRSSSHTRAK